MSVFSKMFSGGRISKEAVEMALNRLPIGKTYHASDDVSITQTDNNVFLITQNGVVVGENLSFVEVVMKAISL